MTMDLNVVEGSEERDETRPKFDPKEETHGLCQPQQNA
jgi:hypothetical protein